jgi:hypothetical protein
MSQISFKMNKHIEKKMLNNIAYQEEKESKKRK